LVYKGLAPTANGLEKIYSRDYVHFQANSTAITQADINSAKQKLTRSRKLLKIHRIPQQLRLLDIGCGCGNFVAIAKQFGYLADGIDPYLPSELENDCLHRKSSESIPSDTYDIVVLLNVAEHLDQPRYLFAEARRLLKPNGVMLLTCPYGDSLARRIYQSCWGHLALDEHLLFWTPRSLTSLLRELGFDGKVSYRIAGSPFPYGQIKPFAAPKLPEADYKPSFHINNQQLTWQARIWKLARTIQQQETTANFVRSLVHLTHTGDYLEYAIGK
jgi:SAM-dependent methyltransferase